MTRIGTTVKTALILVSTLSLAMTAKSTLISRLISIVVLSLSWSLVVVLVLILILLLLVLVLVLVLILSLRRRLICGMFESTSVYNHMSLRT